MRPHPAIGKHCCDAPRKDRNIEGVLDVFACPLLEYSHEFIDSVINEERDHIFLLLFQTKLADEGTPDREAVWHSQRASP